MLGRYTFVKTFAKTFVKEFVKIVANNFKLADATNGVANGATGASALRCQWR